MRTRDILINGFRDITILMQYLYMSKEHYVDIKNSINVPLRIYMNDDAKWMCQNMNFPDVPPMHYQEQMTVDAMLAVIEQLEEQPAAEFPDSFKNRWEEIKTVTLSNLAINVNFKGRSN